MADERAIKRAIGLMSGTSMDGVDAALIETDGEAHLAFGPVLAHVYGAEDREGLRAALARARGLTDRAARPGALAEAERIVTRRHGEIVEALLAEAGLGAGDIDVIGFHGHTVLHRPERGLTVQIGDGPALAERLGIPVVHDLRAADMAAGGQGAPLVPVYHRALALHAGLDLPVAMVNLGGVANVTYIDRDTLIAFDTGPGNALIDDWMAAHAGARMDEGGRAAGAGTVDEARLASLLAHPYFEASAPKSLDRDDFSAAGLEGLGLEDGAATLAAFTARSLARAREHMPRAPRTWIVSGGGARNPVLLAMLSEALGQAAVPADALGWRGDHVEAQAFAYLAVRALAGRPLTFPGTTGIAAPRTGGVLARPSAAGRPAQAALSAFFDNRLSR